ncbi:hypothetical protein [Jannaschia sp. R86511]|uniref:hypothetical protein n=1 Tax=Jannaschia sp. R86511 TaxID=3093853 RepID=UPI0036D25219
MNDVMDGGARVALTLAGQVGERLARAREQAAGEARALADDEAREVQARLAAERAAARAQLALVERDAWWETATTKQISDALQVAVTWQGVDPQAAAAAAVIQRQVQQRYGVNVDQLNSRPDRSGELRSEAGRDAAGSEGAAERTEAGRILADGAQGDGLEYDSPARRQERAARLTEQGQDPESVAAVMSADVSQARPARGAVTVPSTRASTTTAAAPAVREQQVELGR